jgi:hypothetical protein
MTAFPNTGGPDLLAPGAFLVALGVVGLALARRPRLR